MPRAASAGLSALLLATGCLRSVPIDGSSCPCPGGYVCCSESNQCKPEGTACAGTGGTSGSGGTGGSGGSVVVPTPDDAPGPTPLRRLNLLEYRNTVRDLLGDSSATVGGDFVVDLPADYSGYHVGAPIGTGNDLLPFLRAAERLARTAVGNLGAFLAGKCSPTPATIAEQDTCASGFIDSFGLRAFRRPLTPEEAASLRALYITARVMPLGLDFPDAIRVLITAILQSPYFLYRWEGGLTPSKDGALVRLGPYEIASRLSYSLWATMPDAALFDAAATGKLLDPDRIAQEARRLLADPRARDMIGDFHLQWIGVSELPSYSPKDPSFHYSAQVAQSMLAETAAFASSVLAGPQATGRLEALLTSPATFVNEDLSFIYHLPGVVGADLRPYSLDPAQRSGIFTQASFLTTFADETSSRPVMRGTELLHSLLCVELPEPINVPIPPLPDRRPEQTTRQWYDQLLTTPCATSCHSILAIGDAFESYDAVGAYRTREVGQAIDASGSVMLADDKPPLAFQDAVDLTRQLVKRTDAHECMARHWLRYMLRREDGLGDRPSLKSAGKAFTDSALDLRELIVALTRTRAFTHRTPSRGEVLP
jgi:uncharacterized protein DUF1592/uncharacterized protein DUF1588/uncharacterized protein DUF1595/uncharacterized protein DUF1585/uncharacterized protein DUF1587